LLGKL